LSVAYVARPAAGIAFDWPVGRKIGAWTIAAIAFVSAFVMEEPAPYELLLCTAFIIWCAFGLRLNRHMMPMTVLLVVYLAGGFLALTQLENPMESVIYVMTTALLVLSAIFWAAVASHDTEHRLRLLKNGYIASALVASLLGIAGYFHAFPGADVFTLYDRIKGTFKDPNVFGPFAVLPIVFLYRDILTSRLRDSLVKVVLLLILLLAVFLAFSRAAWGMTAFAILFVTFLGFVTERKAVGRLRILIYFGLGMMVIAMLLVVALSIPAVSDLFAQRAQLVESYDSGHLGRFSRHILGFFLVQQRPLGIGPLQFAKLFGEDEHNMWLKGFTTYGWLGGFSYMILVVWTLWAAGRLLLKPRPWTGYLHCIFAVFLGQVMIHNVIDNDHWRHLFLIYGLLWGIIAAERFYRRDVRTAIATGSVPDIPRAPPAFRPAAIAFASGAISRASPPHLTAIPRASRRPSATPRWPAPAR
jgi:hypothetical protein